MNDVNPHHRTVASACPFESSRLEVKNSPLQNKMCASANNIGNELMRICGKQVAECTQAATVNLSNPPKRIQKTVLELPPTQAGLRKRLAKLGLLMAALLPRISATTVHPAIKKGLFGAAEGAKLADATVVSRGDHESRVFIDPSSRQSGLILSGMAHKKMSANCPAPGARFQVALEAALEVHAYWLSLSEAQKVEQITQHVIASSTFASPLVSLSLNEGTAAYFALGARNTSTRVYRGLVSNSNLYASGQPGFEVPTSSFGDPFEMDMPGFSANQDYGLEMPVERWLTIAGNHSIPLSEFLSVGGFYFRDNIDPMIAIRQNPGTFRTPDNLHEVKNISNIQRKIHARTVPALLDFSSEFAQSVKHHTNQTIEEHGFLDPDSFDYYPDHS